MVPRTPPPRAGQPAAGLALRGLLSPVLWRRAVRSYSLMVVTALIGDGAGHRPECSRGAEVFRTPLDAVQILHRCSPLCWLPCISNDLKIGYYITDHTTQTDQQIPELKELAIAMQALIKLVLLQQDLFIYKSTIQTQHEEKIEEQASNLCEYMNDRLTDIYLLQTELQKEVQIQQSYQQQLCDALSVLRENIEFYNINREDTECSEGKLLKLLRNELHEKESIIEDLERKLQEYQEKGRAKMVVFEDDEHEKKMLEKENEDSKEEVFKLHNISHLENALKRSEKEKYLLDKQVQRMQSKVETDEQNVEKLIGIQEQIMAELENERPLVKNQVASLQIVKQMSIKHKRNTTIVGLSQITSVVPEQQAAERTLTAETEKLKKQKSQERKTIERAMPSAILGRELQTKSIYNPYMCLMGPNLPQYECNQSTLEVTSTRQCR
ncbi:LOW QUALITY PROTEIN: uncharacterized protein C10orf67 homolog, mitochondrial [Pterocles gutturalis]